MKRGVLIIFVAILIPCLLQAQTTPNDPQRLTLEQAVNFAVEHNKELQASQMNIELRNKMVTEAISQGLPQINGDLNYSTNFRYKMSFPGSESSTVLKDQSSVGVTVNQLLFSGEWILGIQTSKIAKLIASQEVDVTELDIKETVYNSYYTIFLFFRKILFCRKKEKTPNLMFFLSILILVQHLKYYLMLNQQLFHLDMHNNQRRQS